MVWKNKVTGQESDVLPPMLVETRNTKRPRLHAVLGKADITLLRSIISWSREQAIAHGNTVMTGIKMGGKKITPSVLSRVIRSAMARMKPLGSYRYSDRHFMS